jgi:hypothetical protein
MSENEWMRVSHYAIQSPCGDFTIACVRLNGRLTFEVWRKSPNRWTRLDAFPTSAEAKAHVIPSPIDAAPASYKESLSVPQAQGETR